MTKQTVEATGGERSQGTLLAMATRRIIPLVLLMSFMSYLDRGNLSILATPINQSLGMSATAFGFAVGLFFWGYVAFEVPSNVALLKYGSRRWLARIMVSWGLVTALMFFAQNEWQFGLLRFLLGVAEAGLSPGILMFLTMWFPRSKQSRPFAYYQMTVPLAFIFGALVTSGLLAYFEHVAGPDSGWRWVLLAEGLVSVAAGFVILVALRDRPAHAKWLTPAEAIAMEDAVAAEEPKIEEGEFAGMSELRRIFRALTSGKAWYVSLLGLSMLTGMWAITFWLPQIIAHHFQRGTVVSGFLSAIPWMVAFFAILLVNVTSRLTGDRKWHMFGVLLLGGAGLAVSATTSNGVFALIGLSVALGGIQACLPLLYRLQGIVFTGVMAAVLFAMANSVGSFGGFIGPYIFGFSEQYLGGTGPGLWVMTVFLVVAATLAIFAEKVLDIASKPGAVDRPAAKTTAPNAETVG